MNGKQGRETTAVAVVVSKATVSLFDAGIQDGRSVVVLAVCPKCAALVEDLDGFGVLIHDACGYCSHPSSYGGVCDSCGTAT